MGARTLRGMASLVAVTGAWLSRCPAEQMARQVVMAGTPYEAPYYVKIGDEGWGPKVCVIGGLHGNETAGYVAAGKLANWQITRGVLIVMPEAHQAAIRRHERAYPGNMNAMFPGDPKGDAMQQLAYAIWRVIDYHRPSLLLTLHESIGYHKRLPSNYGYTLCHDFAVLNTFTDLCLLRANADIPDPLHQFGVFVEPHPVCPTYCAWSKLRIPATSIETCMEDDLALRVQYQLMMCMAFFDEAGLGYEQTDLPRLSTASQAPRTALEVWSPHLLALEQGRTPPASYGILRVGANVAGAKVYVDGYYKGCTPASTAVATSDAGRRVKVTVKLEGYVPYTGEADVAPEGYPTVIAELTPVLPAAPSTAATEPGPD